MEGTCPFMRIFFISKKRLHPGAGRRLLTGLPYFVIDQGPKPRKAARSMKEKTKGNGRDECRFFCTGEERKEMENFLQILRSIPAEGNKRQRFLKAMKNMGASFGARRDQSPGEKVEKHSPFRSQPVPKAPVRAEKLTLDQQEAYEILCSRENVLLTGGAGTGKTFLLQKFIAEHKDNTLVTAPSGIAAKKAGGITLHKAFRIPIGILTDDDFNPGDWLKTPDHARDSETLMNLQTAETLIIDEISMVRSDVFSYVMKVIKTLAKGGKDGKYIVKPHRIRVILCGDFYQLSPVIGGKEKEAWRKIYGANPDGWCFLTEEWQEMKFHTCELKQIVRQKDPAFAHALNRIREGSAEGLFYLNTHHADAVQEGPYVCATNKQVNQKNEEKYAPIPHQEYTFYCSFMGQVDPGEIVCEKELKLKVGAKVLFLVNDIVKNDDGSSRNAFQNGSYGEIMEIHQDNQEEWLKVKVEETGTVVKLGHYEWENKKYKVEEIQTEQGIRKVLRQEIIGRYFQYPLRLGWALTVHKSQGQDYEKCNLVKPSSYWARGQLYVALSRCRRIENLYYAGNLSARMIKVSEEVRKFYYKLSLQNRES